MTLAKRFSQIKEMTNTFETAYLECLDDCGKITRLEPLYNFAKQQEAQVRALQRDKARLDYLGGNCLGWVRGTNIPCWRIAGEDGSEGTLRGAIDKAMVDASVSDGGAH